MGTMIIKGKTMRSVDVDWNEFYYTNCPLVSPSNIDQEIGWVKEEFKKIGIAYKFLRSTTENDWYPHYVHNLDNLMRYGGCNPAIHVQADVRRTRLIGTTHVYEGGCMLVRARDADRFYLLLNRLVLEEGLAVEAVAPADADVGSVYQYLIVGEGGEA